MNLSNYIGYNRLYISNNGTTFKYIGDFVNKNTGDVFYILENNLLCRLVPFDESDKYTLLD